MSVLLAGLMLLLAMPQATPPQATGAPTPPGHLAQVELAAGAVKGNASTVKVDVRDANVSGVTIVMHPTQ